MQPAGLSQVERAKADGRSEGRIVSVIDRAQKTVVGQFHCGPRYNYVTAFDHRIPYEIVIPKGEEWPGGETSVPARSRDRQFGGESEKLVRSPESEVRSPRDLEGLVVDVEITSWPTPTKPPVGRVIEWTARWIARGGASRGKPTHFEAQDGKY